MMNTDRRKGSKCLLRGKRDKDENDDDNHDDDCDDSNEEEAKGISMMQ